MLSRAEQADVPHDEDVESQRRIRALGIKINDFVKTSRGRALIETQAPFVLGGKVYQGFSDKALEATEDQLTEAEIDAAEDVDGTKGEVLKTRERRVTWRHTAKEQELSERRRKKISQERDELELAKLKREDPGVLDRAAIIAKATDDGECECPTCGSVFPSIRKLRGHLVGAKH